MTAAAEYIDGALVVGVAFTAGVFVWRLVQFFRRRRAANGPRIRNVRRS